MWLALWWLSNDFVFLFTSDHLLLCGMIEFFYLGAPTSPFLYVVSPLKFAWFPISGLT